MRKLVWNTFTCAVPPLHMMNYISPGDKEGSRKKKILGFNIHLNVK